LSIAQPSLALRGRVRLDAALFSSETDMKAAIKRSPQATDGNETVLQKKATPERTAEPLLVRSVEKAFRVLEAFSSSTPTLSLTALAETVQLDKSAAQRFTYTLEKLGYLYKDPETKRFGLTVKSLDFSYSYLRANALVGRSMPYLVHLSKTTEETINITVLDDTEIVFVTRFMSRHLFNTDVTIGTRMPAYCTAPGIALLSQLPREQALDILERSARQPITENTTWQMDELVAKLDRSAAQGYATAFEEFYRDDLSIAAAIFDSRHRPAAAITISVSKSRFTTDEAEQKLASLVIAAARSISQTG
jgi:DNA-binding IclR family transcriptional regulator